MRFDGSDRVKAELGEDGVAQVRLTRPDKMNALDPAMFDGIIAAIEALGKAPGLRAVVLAGEGRAFCAGIDLAGLQADPNGSNGDLVERTHGDSNRFQQVATGWRKLPVPVIAALHGVCFGGGLQIASGADIRVAAPDTRMSIMELKWGLVPDMGGYALWRGLVRDDVLRELIYTNREFTGEEAVTASASRPMPTPIRWRAPPRSRARSRVATRTRSAPQSGSLRRCTRRGTTRCCWPRRASRRRSSARRTRSRR